MIKGVVFDMDGLMFDTERLTLKGWNEAARQMGYKIREDAVINTIGLNVENTKRVFDDAYGKDFDFAAMRKITVGYVLGQIEEYGIPIKPGLFELLNFLKANGYRTAIATSTETKKVHYYFEKAGVAEYFNELVCGDMVERGKPEPDIYLKASGALGCKPYECLALEDSPMGILSAYRAGLKPVMIPDLVEPNKETSKLLYAKLPSLLSVI